MIVKAQYRLFAALFGIFAAYPMSDAVAQYVDPQCRAQIIEQTTVDWGTPGRSSYNLPETICCTTDAGNLYAEGSIYLIQIHRQMTVEDPRICNTGARRHFITTDISGPLGQAAIDDAFEQAAFTGSLYTWSRYGRATYNAMDWLGYTLDEGHLVEFACARDDRLQMAHVYCPCGAQNGACNTRTGQLNIPTPLPVPSQPVQPQQQVPQGTPIQPGQRQPSQ